MGYTILQYMLILHAYPDKWASDFSTELKIEAAQDTVAPETPSSFAVSAVAEGIKLMWVNPTLNFDGTACKDLAWIAVYRSTSSGIDPDNDATYDKKTLVTGETHVFRSTATSTTFYFVITARDRTGNESVATSELSSTPNAVDVTPSIPDDASGVVFNDVIGGDGVVSGHGIIGIAFKHPADSWTGFDHFRLWWQYTTDGGSIWRDEDGVVDQWTEITPVNRIGHLHKGLDSTGAKAYRYKATVVATDGTESSTADTAGGASTTADASDNTNLVAISIFAMNIVCLGEVRAANVTVDDLAAINADLGAVTAGSIVVGTTNKLWLNEGGDGILAIGGTNKASASFRVSAAGAVTCANLTVTGGAWDGDAMPVAKIPSLDADIITSGTFGVVRIPSLAASIITSGTFEAVRIPNLAADKITSGTLDCGSITVTNLSASSINTGTLSATYISGGTFNASLMTVTNLSASSITTGTLDCSGITVSNLSAASINTGTLSASYISGGTLNASLITVTNLSASSINTGTLSATYISAGTLDFSAISRSSLTIIESELGASAVTSDKIGSGAVTYGKIAANSVRTNELYVDGSIQFKPGSTRNKAIGLDGIYYSNTGIFSSPYIRMQSDSAAICRDGSHYLNIKTSYGYFMGINVGVETISPDRIFATNQGSGNCHFDGIDWWSLGKYKEDVKEASGALEKIKRLNISDYRRVPFVSAEELKTAAIGEFGKERWESVYPEDTSHRGGGLRDCPDKEMKEFIDKKADNLRRKRRGEDKWKRRYCGLIADDPNVLATVPELVSRDKNGAPDGITAESEIGLLLTAVKELSQEVDELKGLLP